MALSNSRYGALLSIPGMLVVLLLVIFPVILLFVTGFLQYTSTKPIIFNGFKNFAFIFNDRLFWIALQKTVIYTVGVTGIAFVAGMLLALALAQVTKGAALLRALSMFSWAVPLVISGFIWKWIFNPDVGVFSDIMIKLGIVEAPIEVFSNPTLSMIGCMVADAWVRIPYLTIFILAGLESVPRELYESAKIDGADAFVSYRWITLPLIRNMVLVGTLITTMFTFRTIDVIFSMTEGGPARATYVLGLYIVDQMWRRVNMGTAAAAGIIMFVLIAAFAGPYIFQVYKKE